MFAYNVHVHIYTETSSKVAGSLQQKTNSSHKACQCLCRGTDNHDIISLKLYQLTVLRSEKEEAEEEEVITLPSVDNMELLRGETGLPACLPLRLRPSDCVLLSPPVGQTDEGMSAVGIFFTVLFSMLGCIFLIVIGTVVYSHWNESRRKRFY